jgi:hypothetical protein
LPVALTTSASISCLMVAEARFIGAAIPVHMGGRGLPAGPNSTERRSRCRRTGTGSPDLPPHQKTRELAGG